MGHNIDNILYVDDEENNLFLFKELFSKQYEVIVTESTSKARSILAKEEIKVVVTDLMMPEENGLEFVKSVSIQYPDIIYIILTAYLDVNTAFEALNQNNIYRYILKPFNHNEVTIALNNAINAYNLKSENKLLLELLKHKNFELEKTLAELKEREQQFYNIFYSSQDGIIIYNKNREIILANLAFYNFTNLTGQEIIKVDSFLEGKNLLVFQERQKRIFTEKLPVSTFEIKLPNGEKKIIEANSTSIQFQGEKVILSIIRDITEREHKAQSNLNEIVKAEERERNRIANDLHDGIGPILTTLKMYIEWLADKERIENSDKILELSYIAVNEAISQLRAISYNLSPHILENFGLIAALQSYFDMIKPRLTIEFKNNIKERLPFEMEISLFRVIKECVNNTIKHSGAKGAFIDIHKNSQQLTIKYSDNGIGCDIKTLTLSKGVGMNSIKNRINSLGGELDISSETNKGVSINISLNLN